MEAEIAILKKLNENGITREQAAADVGLSRVHYTNILTGANRASEPTLRGMLYQLGYEKITVEALVDEYFKR